MHQMTQNNLENAFAGESKAHMRYLIFADKAEQEGKVNVARLFRAIAYAERVHATNHLNALGGVAGTEENLALALEGENYEIQEMYPAYNNEAKMQNEQEAVKSTHYALEAEKNHAFLYKKTKELVSKGQDIDIGKINICPVCGYTAGQADAADICPVCGVKKEEFKQF
jgi:rubrerythrin